MRKLSFQVLLLAALAGANTVAFCEVRPASGKGELLYTTHCNECHTTQLHWREKRRAVDWTSLKVQVRRWQDNAGLGWSESDIVDVTRYLNDTIYRYPQTSDRLSLAR